jgi:tetratricopeptide (TPR) repeat protein
LAVLAEAQKLYEELIEHGGLPPGGLRWGSWAQHLGTLVNNEQDALKLMLIDIWLRRAYLLQAVGDTTGYLAFYKRSLDSLDLLASKKGNENLVIGNALLTASSALSARNVEEALEILKRAEGYLHQFQLLETVIGKKALAWVHANRAIKLAHPEHLEASVAEAQKAINVLLGLMPSEFGTREEELLGRCYFTTALAAEQEGKLEEAFPLYNQAIAHLKKLWDEGEFASGSMLGLAYFAKGQLLVKSGKESEAAEVYGYAIRIRELLMEGDLVGDVIRQLAETHLTMGWLDNRRGDHCSALRHYQRATSLYENLARMPCRANVLVSLALANLNAGSTLLQDLKDPCAALPYFDQAIPIYEYLMPQNRWPEVPMVLARAYAGKACCLSVGHDPASRDYFQKCEDIVASVDDAQLDEWGQAWRFLMDALDRRQSR